MNTLKDYSKKQIQQLNNLITLLLGDLSKGDRQKIMTICTLDVHSRDIVLRMISEKDGMQLNILSNNEDCDVKWRTSYQKQI